MTSIVSPPVALNLKWKPVAGSYRAKQSDAFYYAERAIGHTLSQPACIELDRSEETVDFNPVAYEAEPTIAWFAALQVSADEREEMLARQRKFYFDIKPDSFKDAVRAVIAEGQALYDKYGAGVRRVVPLLNLIALEHLEGSELKRLRKLIAEIKLIVANLEGDAVTLGAKEDVDLAILDDDFVVRGVRKLTALDQDHNELANNEGWGKDTTAPGHWCAALLDTDRDRAIEIGRILVSRHLPQLARLGIVPASVAARRAA